jgi:hypothetical protein
VRSIFTFLSLSMLMASAIWSSESGGNGHAGPPPGGADCPLPPGNADDQPPPPPPPSPPPPTTNTSGGSTTSGTGNVNGKINVNQVFQQIFTAADTDNSGSLNEGEFDNAAAAFHAFMEAHRPADAPTPPADTHTAEQKAAHLAKSFTQADANGDGVLSFAEFTVAMRMVRPPHPHPHPHHDQ